MSVLLVNDSAATRSALWSSVDALTRPTRVPVARDDSSVVWTTTPSLLEQADDVLASSGGVGQRVSAFDRAPTNLGLLTARILIATTTRSALLRRRQTPTGTVAHQVRTLGAFVATHEPERLDGHTQRFSSWARMLMSHLATERTVSAVHIRNAACPKCTARRATVIGPDGTEIVVPALVIRFYDGHVRAAECQQCTYTVWRGDLEDLATELGCASPA